MTAVATRAAETYLATVLIQKIVAAAPGLPRADALSELARAIRDKGLLE